MGTIELGGGASLVYVRGFVEDESAIMARLIETLPLRSETLRIYGREVPMPRLTAWHGDFGYRYSGKKFDPHPWTPELLSLRDQIETEIGVRFNSVLANLYRGGKDSVSWHADDEPEIDRTVIASVSLGEERRFLLRRKDGNGPTMEYRLGRGDLFVMRHAQTDWLHSVPKAKGEIGARLNLTFRIVKG